MKEICGGAFLQLYFKCISIQAPYRVVGIQQLYCFSIVKEVLDLPPCATAILLGVVFAQMMYHHSVNQQMSLKLKRCAFLLFLNLWWDLMLAKIQKPGYQQSDWKKMYPGNQKREQKGPKRTKKKTQRNQKKTKKDQRRQKRCVTLLQNNWQSDF